MRGCRGCRLLCWCTCASMGVSIATQLRSLPGVEQWTARRQALPFLACCKLQAQAQLRAGRQVLELFCVKGCVPGSQTRVQGRAGAPEGRRAV